MADKKQSPSQSAPKFTPFDVADYLNDEETIAAYLVASLEDPNPEVYQDALRAVARARKMHSLEDDKPSDPPQIP